MLSIHRRSVREELLHRTVELVGVGDDVDVAMGRMEVPRVRTDTGQIRGMWMTAERTNCASGSAQDPENLERARPAE